MTELCLHLVEANRVDSARSSERRAVKFIEFTNVRGQIVAINPDVVSLIRPPINGVDPPGGNAIIVMESGATENVCETVKEAEAKLSAS
jgi:hypothetical protein